MQPILLVPLVDYLSPIGASAGSELLSKTNKRLSPIKDGLQHGRVLMRDLYRHHSVMQSRLECC